MSNKPTYELDVEIKEASSIKDFIEKNQNHFQETAFLSYLHEMYELKNIAKSLVVKNSNLSQSYVYELLRGSKRKPDRKSERKPDRKPERKEPTRDPIIQLAFGLSLDLEQTNRLLKLAGHGELYTKKKRDSIIIYCINTSRNIFYANEVFHEEGLALF